MHPAKSVIYFTIATGAGYGLFFWLALLAFHGLLPANKIFAFTALAISFGLIITGLLSSTLHLGHPKRAWRAFSQWRSSWLSREGVMAILTFIPMSLFAIAWVLMGKDTGVIRIIGLIGAVMALITVFTTSMIYASIKAIPAWHNIWTKLSYLVLSLMSGSILAMAIVAAFGYPQAYHLMHPTAVFIVLGLIVKILYWMHILTSKLVSTAESATGLGKFGEVSLAASPHSEDNYLLKEMGYQIARKHATKIRVIVAVLAFLVPLVLIFVCMHSLGGTGRTFGLIATALICMIGLVFERWLFFAEAKHAVMLFYGEQKV
ncbi:MAG: DmsC/YnfH family molybdoenzyme membrane anchor subunit [Robiginitomaculum sp.]